MKGLVFQDVDIKSGNHKMFCGVKHLMGGFMDDARSEILVVAIDTIGYFFYRKEGYFFFYHNKRNKL